ncbi:zonular occludens toxin domain-containing protein [Campylobacter corcagiensis]|uniref:Zonula occludens toxin n=1 Tax=Campylobacter corcagiensis TaxID=1448857 RepID=A0A7M1LGW5_9BACT|nr:zonular occludens toxin domain-containing protein [Campylobacter corcagiensis]QKF64223.1 zonula occludens toxin (Zot) family protein [Campylobacter corcagiensis]QOQ87583.1 zonula occludens toxin [Campylobacter corcagiensis]
MAISYITGIPGSGKSYFAVYQIYKEFLESPKKKGFLNFKKQEAKKSKYEFLYTNINQFKFELKDNFIPFDNTDFNFKLNQLYEVYKSTDGKDDALLIEKAKELDLYQVLIVLDEAHNFLNDKEDEVLKWWLTYHRHLYQDIILITQDFSLIATGYKSIAEYFYKAIPAQLRLFKNKFRYQQFSSYKLFDKDLVNRKGIHIPILPEVFALYHSGDKTSQKSFIRRFILIGILIFIVLFIAFKFFISNIILKDAPKDNAIKIDEKTEISNNEFLNSVNITDQPYKNRYKFTYQFYCIKGYCNLKGEKEFLPYDIVSNIVIDSNPVYAKEVSSFKDMQIYIYVFENPVFDFLKTNLQGVSDEKNSFNSSFVDF